MTASDSFHSGHERICLHISCYAKRSRGSQLSVAGVDVKSTSGPVNVEKILKEFKTHRCAMDFDNAFCIMDLHEK